ncbi:DUF6221 family protein [Streptomyces sp. NPDC046759]|uniref:DUF6221 family protein n=1 Tax=Streptomyces sp. NPDC046759 TaxID=3155019 RepID=UPI0033C639E0
MWRVTTRRASCAASRRGGRCRRSTGRRTTAGAAPARQPAEAAGRPAPCATLRLLALPFAGHPAYRESWRP